MKTDSQFIQELVEKITRAKMEFEEEKALHYFQQLIEVFAKNAKIKGLKELRGQYYELKIL